MAHIENNIESIDLGGYNDELEEVQPKFGTNNCTKEKVDGEKTTLDEDYLVLAHKLMKKKEL